jgi:hypothetical protein
MILNKTPTQPLTNNHSAPLHRIHLYSNLSQSVIVIFLKPITGTTIYMYQTHEIHNRMYRVQEKQVDKRAVIAFTSTPTKIIS